MAGSKWKIVSCRNCGCEYVYQVRHTTSGTAENPFWLNRQGAINKAEARANRNLEKYLEKKMMHYSCPECGNYQPHAVIHMRNEIWLKGIIFGLITGFSVVFAVGGLAYFHWIFIVIAIICGLASGAIVSVIVLSKLLNFNPNADATARKNQKFSDKYPVLKNSDIELLLSTTQELV